LTSYLTANPNSDYVPGAEGYFYSFLTPREWDANANFLALVASYESPTGRTYFWVTTTLATWGQYTDLMKDVVTVIESYPTGVWPVNALTAISCSGTTVTATTTTAHGVSVGQWFSILGCTPAGYNGTFQAQLGTTGNTLVYTVLATVGTETALGVLEANLYANTGVSPSGLEFSAAAFMQHSLSYRPSTTNKVTPFAFGFIYGVTPFPTRGNAALIAQLKAGSIGYVGTGAEGGISGTIILWGETMDGNDFTYWYSVDWVQINLDINTANAVINGSNDPINPLYYNQPGINRLQGVGVSTMTQGITYGLVNGDVVATQLDGPVLDANLDAGLYTGNTVVNAVPFITYSLENPSAYKERSYAGLSTIYVPQVGFINIQYTVVVTELIAL
jgi:hypothetical protein